MLPPRPAVHSAIVPIQQAYQADLVQEVAAAIAAEKVVVVGVGWLAPGRKARQLLEAENIPYKYLQYGNYIVGWRRRLALKMWVGWSTFPLIFINGTFVGGASNLRKLIQAGQLKPMLEAPRA